MAASYHVRIGGKEHGPFNGAQLKKLVQKGQLTEDAEIRQGDGDKWYPATKVAGLFDDAPSRSAVEKAAAEKSAVGASKSGASKSGDSAARKSAAKKPAAGKSAAGKRTKKKAKKRPAKAVVDATDVFDLDSGGGDGFDDVEFVDEEEEFDEVDFVDEDDDLFEDDFDDRPVRSKSRGSRGGRRRKSGGGGSWDQVRVGLLLIGIGVCLLTGSFAFQALAELIVGLTVASGSIPSTSTQNMLELLLKGSVCIAPLGNITALIGCSFAICAPNSNGAKGLAIAGVATFVLHSVTHFIYVFRPIIFQDRAPALNFRIRGGASEVDFLVAWFPLFAALILTSILLWAIASTKGDYSLAGSCMSNVWIIGAFVVLYVVGYLVGQVWEPKPTSRGTAKALIWLFVLLRLGHLSIYGVYLGRLIPQTFSTRNSV